MTDHLPECLLPDFDKGAWVCICAQLRACEQRMLDDDVLAAAYHGQAGYAAGLDAAREAVAALPMMKIAGNFPLYDADDALAAIDALKEDE